MFLKAESSEIKAVFCLDNLKIISLWPSVSAFGLVFVDCYRKFAFGVIVKGPGFLGNFVVSI